MDIVCGELALWDDPDPPYARLFEYGMNECGSDAAPCEGLRNLRVEQYDPSVCHCICGERRLTVHRHLEAVQSYVIGQSNHEQTPGITYLGEHA